MSRYNRGLSLIKFVADKFYNYYFAWKRILAKITRMDAGVPISCKKYGLKHNNNAIERYDREIKRRMHAIVIFHTFDGVKDFFCTANNNLQSYNPTQNYITSHKIIYPHTKLYNLTQ